MPAAPPDLILTFSEYRAAGERLAAALQRPCAEVDLYRFPDGETRVRLPQRLPKHVALCRSLFDPDVKLIELLLAAGGARALGVQRLSLVAPYLCYMRQDMAFAAGEAVSQRIVGAFLAEHFDAVITVDPHLHRIARLEQAIPSAGARALSAAPLLAEFLKSRVPGGALLIGPDAESRQWVAAIAAQCACEYQVAEKCRRGDRDVSVQLPRADVAGRNVVLVDDMVSTGNTLARVAEQLREAGAARIDALVTHALFRDRAEAALRDAGIGRIWSSDSIPHASNAVHLAPLLTAGLQSV